MNYQGKAPSMPTSAGDNLTDPSNSPAKGQAVIASYMPESNESAAEDAAEYETE